MYNKILFSAIIFYTMFLLGSIFLFQSPTRAAFCPLNTEVAYKSISERSVYYITKECTKRVFTHPDIYFSYFDSWDDVQVTLKIILNTVEDDSLGFMPWGPKYDPQYGALVKTVFDPRVYLLLGDEKYWITAEDVFNTLYNQAWGWIEDVDPRLLEQYSTGEEISYTHRHPNNTIIKYADDPKVYRLEADPNDSTKQVKRHVADEESFNALKFRWDRIVTIDKKETYNAGDTLKKKAKKQTLTPLAPVSEGSMRFTVTVPENTHHKDIIYIHPYGNDKARGRKMTKIAPNTHTIELSTDDFDPVGGVGGDHIWYRYSRNGWNYITAEYLTPDTNDYFWTRRGRDVLYKKDGEQEDMVERWRWFPDKPIQTDNIASLNVYAIVERVGKTRFRSGVGIQDLHINGFEDFFATTADHLRSNNYEWAVLFPSWQWTVGDPLPKLKNDIRVNPNYPDNILLKQIQDYKRHGIKIMVMPQICCTEIDTENRGETWWKEYFNEIEGMVVHHARIAQAGGAEAFAPNFARVGITEGLDSVLKKIEQDAWRRIAGSVRAVFSGEVGQMVWNFDGTGKTLSPEIDFINWGDALDFFYIQQEVTLLDKNNPSEEELKNAVEKSLAQTKNLYTKFKKPIMLQTAFHSRKAPWKANALEVPVGTSECGESDTEDGCMALFNGWDQARLTHAYWQAIAESPWIIGYTHFGYWQYPMPRLPDWSIRDKTSEAVFNKWSSAIYGSSDSSNEGMSRLPTLKDATTNKTVTDALCEKNRNPVFTSDITDLSLINAITAPGGTTPGGDWKGHSFMWIKNAGSKVPVYAPVDMVLDSGAYYMEEGEANYTLGFEVTCEIRIKLDHIKEPVQIIRNQFPATPRSTNDTRGEAPKQKIRLKSGDLIGYTTGTVIANNWDFGVYDTEVEAREKVVCQFDFYPKTQKNVYYNLFVDTTGSGTPTTAICNSGPSSGDSS